VTTSQNTPAAPDAGVLAAPGPRPPRERLGTVATIVAAVGVVAAFVLIGPALSSEPTTTTVAVGEVVGVGDLQMTAGPLTPGDSVAGRTLCSTVTYRNTGSAPESIDALYDWKLRDPSGEVVPAGVFGTDSALSAGQLGGGRSISGDVCFDRTAARSGRYVVQFDPMGFSSDRGAWLNQVG
jgi:hypothetical protein